ncbi:uncharacterized protein BJ212DRAFT_1473526, partial [Suillus subaureus]
SPSLVLGHVTVASEVFTEAQSFADCKLHIRTRLLASAFSNFCKPLCRDASVGENGAERISEDLVTICK